MATHCVSEVNTCYTEDAMLSTLRKNTTDSAYKKKTSNIKKSMEEKCGDELSELSSECESTIAEVKDIVQILESVETEGWKTNCGMPHDKVQPKVFIDTATVMNSLLKELPFMQTDPDVELLREKIGKNGPKVVTGALQDVKVKCVIQDQNVLITLPKQDIFVSHHLDQSLVETETELKMSDILLECNSIMPTCTIAGDWLGDQVSDRVQGQHDPILSKQNIDEMPTKTQFEGVQSIVKHIQSFFLPDIEQWQREPVEAEAVTDEEPEEDQLKLACVLQQKYDQDLLSWQLI